jgi:hypothetical protein
MIEIPCGTIELVEIDDPASMSTRFEVRHADPVVKVTSEMIEKITAAQRLVYQLRIEGFPVRMRATIISGVLTLYPENTELYGDRIIYRQVAYLAEEDCYVFAWPD